MLPNTRTIFSMSEKNTIPLDVFFNSSENSGHARMLRKIVYFLRNKHKNVLTNNEMKKNNVMNLHLGEISMQTCVSFTNKIHLLGYGQNDAKKLVNSIQVFLLNTPRGKN